MPVSDFQPVIGLEVHAQLLTASKIFCRCSTAFGAAPNANTCPVCLGLPGVLPVLNRQVVRFAIRTGLALGCTVRERSVWSRKNYFYPDLPKGYQVTQFDLPICEHGELTFPLSAGESAEDGPGAGVSKTVRVARIHMEEDAGKSVHEDGAPHSLVDLNRAGVPLLEIVSEPDLRSSDEAVDYLKTLRDVLVYLGVNDGNLEEGSFRCDANVSVMKKGSDTFGTRVELKNINSFRFVKAAIEYEIERQVESLEAGTPIVQETRLWDTQRHETRSMRSKEDAHDYRYFPEPDLPPLALEPAWLEEERAALPELPLAKQARFVRELGLPAYDARLLASQRPMADFFEQCLKAYGGEAKKVSNWFLGELSRLLNETPSVTWGSLRITPTSFAALLRLVDGGTLSTSAAKDVFTEMFQTGADPAKVVEEKGLGQVSDTSVIEAVVDEVLARCGKEVESYKAGKKQVMGFLTGQAMKAMKGKGNPQVIQALIRARIGD